MLLGRALLSKIFALVLVAGAGVAWSQASEGSKAAGLPEVLALGQSAVPLAEVWRFEPGDSPIASGRPVWAEPAFDDSGWQRIDMDAGVEAGGDPPGWIGRGFPGLVDGYAWYRLRVRVATAGEPLWLMMPDYFDDAYQVYANGQLLGGAGFRGGRPVAYYSRPHSFALPRPDAQGLITIALRFWLDRNTRFDNATAGGLHAAPLVGLASTIKTLQAQQDSATVLNLVVTGGSLPLFFLLAAAASFWAWLKVRRERAYLWLSIRLMINVAAAVVYDLAVAGLLAQNVATVMQTVVFRSVLTPCWMVFWWHWFKLRKDGWILRATALLMVLDFASALCARATVHGVIPMHWAAWLSPTNTLVKFGELTLLAVILVKGYRRDRTEALFALFPLAINEIDIFNGFSLEGRMGWDAPVLGMRIPPSAVASFLLVLTILMLAVRRFLAIHSRQMLAQQAIEAELVQASELQKRVLVPETTQSAYFRVETAYFPAQAVGGDFFQVLSHRDGSMLIVLGDVSGKGVTAAFLVAVLVGAIRTRADDSLDPVGMLRMLNTRLIDRSEGHFATCLAMSIDPEGKASIANAGHLPPYWNGEEIETNGALPLGLLADAEVSVVTLQLQPGDRLTLLSDGVVEAMDGEGELFGFARTRAVSERSAQEIADEARLFGQQDDITVVTVELTGAAVEALVEASARP